MEEEKENQLIPGLPDEIAVECLVKVPYQFHSSMKSVCHAWQNLISDLSFYEQRLKSGNSEQLICLVQPLPPLEYAGPLNGAATGAVTQKEDKPEVEQQQKQIHSPPQFALNIYNATQNIWRKTSPPGGIPLFCQCLSVPSSGKILLLGGWDSTTLEPVPDVYILDLAGAGGCRWKRGAPMSVSRSFFACAVLGPSTIYVAGGHDRQKNALKSAEVYDVERNEWRVLPDMIEARDECQGLVWEGDSRFWVVSGYGTSSQGQFKSDAECYDPDTKSWSKIDGVWPFANICPRGPTVPVSVNKNQYQWWWVLGGEPQQTQPQQEQQLPLPSNGGGGEVKNNDEMMMKWEVVSSISLPYTGTNPCVINLGYGDNKQRMFVMSSSGGRSQLSLSCSECDCGATFILEKDCNNGNSKWNHIHTPAGFSGFPFSGCHLSI